MTSNKSQVTDSKNPRGADNQQERPDPLIIADEELAWFIVGFVEGEGSFNISLRRKADYGIGWQPVLSFNVSQRDERVLFLLRDFFGGGIVKRRKDGLHSYDVTNPQVLSQAVVPFFARHGFCSLEKQRNFSFFAEAVEIMVRKQHLTLSGFHQLLQLRESINQGKGRKRKYVIKSVLESSETLRQALSGLKPETEMIKSDLHGDMQALEIQ